MDVYIEMDTLTLRVDGRTDEREKPSFPEGRERATRLVTLSLKPFTANEHDERQKQQSAGPAES